MPALESGFIQRNTINRICTITFYHPQSNSLPSLLLTQLTDAINVSATDIEIAVIVLQSEGEGAFCAGASFDELATIKTQEEGLAFFSGFANLVNAMRKCPKIIIGRIHGKCVGGGVGIAAACDYAIASHSASIKLSELAIGIGPFVIGPVVELKTGRAAFAQLAIDAYNWRSAEWALNKGLYAAIYDTPALLNDAVSTLADKLSGSSAEAMKALKQVCWQGTENWDELLMERAAISGELVLSSFTQDAIKAFKMRLKTKA